MVDSIQVPIVVHHHPENPKGRDDREGKFFYIKDDPEKTGDFLESWSSWQKPNGEVTEGKISNLLIRALGFSHSPNFFEVPVRHSKLVLRADIKKRPEEADGLDWVQFVRVEPRLIGPSVTPDSQKSIGEYE